MRAGRKVGVEGFEEEVERGAEEKGEGDLGDEDAGEEEDADGGKGGETGVEGGLALKGLGSPEVAEKGEEEDGNGLREVRGKGVEAEDAEGDGVEPIRQGSFFEVADAVDVEGDPVAGEGHGAGGVGVGAVGVVEQGRGEEGREEEDDPQAAEDGDGRGTARSDLRGEHAGGSGAKLFGVDVPEGEVGHERSVPSA